MNASDVVDAAFVAAVRQMCPQLHTAANLPMREGAQLTGVECREIFEAQLASRHLDLAARWLRARGEGF